MNVKLNVGEQLEKAIEKVGMVIPEEKRLMGMTFPMREGNMSMDLYRRSRWIEDDNGNTRPAPGYNPSRLKYGEFVVGPTQRELNNKTPTQDDLLRRMTVEQMSFRPFELRETVRGDQVVKVELNDARIFWDEKIAFECPACKRTTRFRVSDIRDSSKRGQGKLFCGKCRKADREAGSKFKTRFLRRARHTTVDVLTKQRSISTHLYNAVVMLNEQEQEQTARRPQLFCVFRFEHAPGEWAPSTELEARFAQEWSKYGNTVRPFEQIRNMFGEPKKSIKRNKIGENYAETRNIWHSIPPGLLGINLLVGETRAIVGWSTKTDFCGTDYLKNPTADWDGLWMDFGPALNPTWGERRRRNSGAV